MTKDPVGEEEGDDDWLDREQVRSHDPPGQAPSHRASLDRDQVPIRFTSHDAASRGLTAVVIGDQAPFTYRLRVFDVKHVYVFLRHVEEYQQA